MKKTDFTTLVKQMRTAQRKYPAAKRANDWGAMAEVRRLEGLVDKAISGLMKKDQKNHEHNI